jgi:hypothetical protein
LGTLRFWAATAVIAVTPTTTTTTTTATAATLVATLAALIAERLATLGVGIAVIGARFAGLEVALTAVFETAATTTAAMTTFAFAAGLTFAVFGLRLRDFGRLGAEQALQPSEETTRFLDRRGFDGSVFTTFEVLLATRFTRLKRLLLAWLEGLWFTRFERTILAIFAAFTVLACFTLFRAEGGTLITLGTGVLIMSAIAPAHRGAANFSGRENFDLGLFRGAGRNFRLRRGRLRLVAGHRRRRQGLGPTRGGGRDVCGKNSSGLGSRLVDGGNGRGRFARERIRILALGRDDLDG